jgi:hypothetical protein
MDVSRREVLNNIIRFKDNLLARKRGGARETPAGRSYPVLLNKKTGDLRFAQRIEEIEPHFERTQAKQTTAKDWKEIHIEVLRKGRQIHFEIWDEAHKKLAAQGLEPLAYKVIAETLEALNRLAQEHPEAADKPLPEEELLHDLSQIHIDPLALRFDDQPGWLGSLTRCEAEQMLQKRPPGTYLIRAADRDTEAIVFHLSQENQMTLEAYVCTYKDHEDKISEVLLLRTPRGWTWYQDDPRLTPPHYSFYSTPQALLQSLRSKAKHPLR